MKIAVIGLGLIGGSLAKAIKKNYNYTIVGEDINNNVLNTALEEGVIDAAATPELLKKCDIVLVALYPQATIDYITKNSHLWSSSTTIVDCCGVKRCVCQSLWPLAAEKGFTFIGGHPMAGLEVAGYENANAELYTNASMILTPEPEVKEELIKSLSEFFLGLGFGHIEITTPENHDKNIAYTSQLAHVVSNAYVKSPGAAVHKGFSAGSYKDLTRVAKLSEDMWTELFLENDDFLLTEIKLLVHHLQEYAEAIENRNAKSLHTLLKAGRERKELVD